MSPHIVSPTAQFVPLMASCNSNVSNWSARSPELLSKQSSRSPLPSQSTFYTVLLLVKTLAKDSEEVSKWVVLDYCYLLQEDFEFLPHGWCEYRSFLCLLCLKSASAFELLIIALTADVCYQVFPVQPPSLFTAWLCARCNIVRHSAAPRIIFRQYLSPSYPLSSSTFFRDFWESVAGHPWHFNAGGYLPQLWLNWASRILLTVIWKLLFYLIGSLGAPLR